jgi:hypothetical protein
MMLFVAFVATLNLCVGYVIGVYVGILPTMPRRLVIGSPRDEVRPAAKPPITAETYISPTPHPLDADPQFDTAAITEDILAGLASFRQKLAEVNSHLHQVDGSRESIDHCAGELRQANDEYMSEADQALARLESSAAPDPTHHDLKATLAHQAQQVQQANTTLDELRDNPDTELVHRRLLETTGELDERAIVVEQKASEVPARRATDKPRTAPSPSVSQTVPTGGTVEMTRLLEAASRHLTEESANRPLQMAAASIDSPATGEENPDMGEGLLQLVESVLGPNQLAAVGDDNSVVMLLAGDDQVAAIQRCERLRQLVAASSFAHNGNTLRVTATCSIVTAAPNMAVDQVVTRLHESLAEARRYGPNRCLHHDGKFPAPVVPHTMDVVGMVVGV